MKTITLPAGIRQVLGTFFFTAAVYVATYAQQPALEAGLLGGVTYYSGELDPQLLGVIPGDMHPAGGFFLRLNTTPHTAVRLSFLQGKVSADDANARNQELVNRNLSFSSDIQELGLTFEYNLFGLRGKAHSFFSPYVFGGIAVFHFNPQAKYQGEWVALQPLGTEGQGSATYPDRKPYSLTSTAFPIGAGVKMTISPRISFGVETGLRYTLTDYLDDVSTTYPVFDKAESGGALTVALSDRILTDHSFEAGSFHTRGNPDTKDWYYFAGFSFSWHFDKAKSGRYALSGKGVKCYHF